MGGFLIDRDPLSSFNDSTALVVRITAVLSGWLSPVGPGVVEKVQNDLLQRIGIRGDHRQVSARVEGVDLILSRRPPCTGLLYDFDRSVGSPYFGMIGRIR